MKKESNQEKNMLKIKVSDNAVDIFREVIKFLQLFLPVTLAKRLVVIVLLAIGIPVKKAVELTGMCERSIRSVKKICREHQCRIYW